MTPSTAKARCDAVSLAFLLLTLGLASACASGVAVTKPEKLKDAVTQYNRHIRWGNTNAAAGYIPFEKRGAFKDAHADNDMVILGVEVGAVEADYEGGIAEVRVRYEWRETNGITVKKTSLRQLWKYEDEHWLLHSKTEIKKKSKRNKRFRKSSDVNRGADQPAPKDRTGGDDWADEVVDHERMERPKIEDRF